MQASIIDLRYKMKDVLKALERNEDVTILYHGAIKGVITNPVRHTDIKVINHPFFDMDETKESIDASMENLRGGRFRDL